MADQSSKTESSPARPPAFSSTLKEIPLVRRSPSTARAVGSFVPRLTRKAMEKFGFSTAALLTDWAGIVGDELARHTRPQKLKWPKGVEAYAETPADARGRPGAMLLLQVDGTRALEVEYRKRQIADRINAYFGYRAVAEIRLEQVHSLSSEKAALPRDVVAPRPVRDPRAGVDLGTISDERLRAALERVQKGMARR